MRPLSKLLLAAFAATLCMGLVVGTASANKISVTSRTFRMTWSALRFEEEEERVAIGTCPMTLEGSFHSSTIAKVAESVIGFVTRAGLGPCTGEMAEESGITGETLPWDVTYSSFSGTLPNITAVEIGFRREMIHYRIGLLRCLYKRTPVGRRRLLLGGGGLLTGVEETATIVWVRISGTTPPCRKQIRAGGVGTVSVLGSTASITIRLI